VSADDAKPKEDPALPPAPPPAPGLPLWLWLALLTVAIAALMVVVGRRAFAA
jgi:hypothetical protein